MDEEKDYLNMSDEDFLNEGEPDFSDMEEEPVTDTDEPVEEDPTDETDSEQDEDQNLESEEEDSEADEDEQSESEEEPEESDDDDSDDETEEDTDTEDDEEDSEDVDTEEDSDEHKKELDKLYAPFKANGREMKVNSVDEAVQLMQMGANYTKKMSALKPHLRLARTMEKHGVSEQDLSFFIDLKNKKPEAIARYLSDAGVDPLDLDLEKSSEYKPQSYTATDQEVDLNSTLEELKEEPGFNKTLEIVGNKWDDASRTAFKQQPQLLRNLHAHVANGVYDQVMSEVDKLRAFGELNGLSDLQAYETVGMKMFADQEQSTPQEQAQPAERKVVKRVGPKPDKSNPKVKDRKKAASPVQEKSSQKTEPEYNPLSMSDEEYEKQLSKMQRFV